MDLPILNNFAPPDRLDSTQFSVADSAPAKTDASFTNLFARREQPVDSRTTREDETNEPAMNETTPVAVPAQPAARQQSDAQADGAMNTDRGEQPSEATDTDGAHPHDPDVGRKVADMEAPDGAASQDEMATSAATASKAVESPVAVTEPVQPITDQNSLPKALPQQAHSDPSESETSASVAQGDGTQRALTEPSVDPQPLPSTEVPKIPAETDGAVTQSDESADRAHPKQHPKRTRPVSGKNDASALGPAGGKGSLARLAATAQAVVHAADELTDQQQLAGNRAGDQVAESTELHASTDQNPRTAAPTDRTPEHMLTRNSVRAQGSREMSQVDQTRLIQRVARAIHAAPQQGGVIRLRLRPPELGSLHLEINMKEGGLTARLEAETHMARSVLLDNLPQLRQRLAEQGIRIEQFDVDVSQEDTGQSQQQTDQTNNPFEPMGPESDGSNHEEPADDLEMANETTHVISQRNLNVVI